jgi:crotonobetainyl-CoA:carnitine CoA-transferase CaiB-like acyl-CoA transferase
MKKALEGITIIDFSQLLAGPFATMMLGDMGANIIKIERPSTGDGFRGMTFFNSYLKGGDSPCFMAWNRNKRSLAIDIKNPQAKDIIYDMIQRADVVVENFRPGVMDRLGYGYEELQKINSKLVYASNSGFGPTGPYVTRPGQDMLVQGLTGLTKLTGRKNDPPTPLGTGLPDMLAAFHLIYGILSALIYCARTGEGQHVQVDLMRSTLALESQEFMTLLNMPVKYERPDSGIGHPFQQAPFGIYRCSDGYISIAMVPFATLVEVLDTPSLMRFAEEQTLFERRDEVFGAIEAVTSTMPLEYWLEKMLARDLWVAPIKDITEVEFDPQIQHMQAFSNFEHKKAGILHCVSPAVSMSITQPVIEKAPPMVGEHSREILREYGVDEETISQMLHDNIVSE